MARSWLGTLSVGRRRRQILPGQSVACSRRTTRRHYLFTPDEWGEVENAFWYCLAQAAHEHGIEVHAAVLMSTHPHTLNTDKRGTRPLFYRDFHRNFANFLKVFRGWPAEVLDKRQTAEHEPLAPEAMVRDIAYLIVNPPSAFAVRYPKDWPGPKTLPRDIGRRVVRAKRPSRYFDPNNPKWPEVIELELTMPAILLDAYGEEEARTRIAAEVHRLQREAVAEARRKGIAFKGARRVMRTPHTARARSYEVDLLR